MSNPQQPELARSRKTPAQDQDAVAGVLDGQPDIGADAPRGPVPAENQPGHHPTDEQDKPDLNAFAAKLGTMEPAEREEFQEQQVTPGGQTESRGRVVALAAAALAALVAILTVRRRRSRR